MNAKTKTADCGLLKAKPIKVISVLVTLLCMAFAMTITANAAGTFSYYVLEDDTVKIVSYAGDDTTVTIPASLSSGKKVSMIVNTFNGSSTVKEVIVSDGVATIGENTFANCESLEYVTILSNSIAIDSTAFDNSAAVINCYSGSSAEAYAIENNISYQILPESVTLGKTSLTLGVGETYTVKTQIAPSNASAVMTWTSSNKSVATVDSNGKITAVKAGTATIKATLANGKTSSCSLTVKKMSTSVSLNKTSLTLGIGESYDINSSVPSGTYAYYRNYTNSDSSVVSLDSQAVVTAKKAGTSTITCTLSNGKKATCTVTVKEMATKLTLNKTSITLGIGETYDLNSSVGSGTASYYRTYASSNTSVATVKEAGGLITAKKAGTATITCKLTNGTKATCTVTVKKMSTSVTLNKTRLTLGIGESYDLDSYVPSGTYAYYRNYSSSNTSVAAMGSSGVVTAKKAGTSTITCKLSNGKKATCTVTVKKMATSVSLNVTSLTMLKGETYDIDSYIPSGTYAYYRNYTSSNSSVAKLGSSGVVTAKKAGTATITCTLSNGKKATCKITVVTSSTKKTTSAGTTMKLNKSWSSSSVVSVPKGATVYQYASSGNWRKVKYGSNYGWIYNKAFGVSKNYSSISTSTLPTVVDDILFDTGTSIKSIFNYVYNMGYRSGSNGSVESLCVYMLKNGRGACYHHAALLYYMLDRAGYDALIVQGKDLYTGGGPHAWCMVKTNGNWRHIDATAISGLTTGSNRFYLVKDSVISPYFSWDRTKYPAAK